MSPKRLAVAIAAFVVLCGIALVFISGTVGVGLSGHSPATSQNPPAAGASDSGGTAGGSAVARDPSPDGSNPASANAATELPRPVLAAARQSDQPDADTVKELIRAVDRAGVGGTYSGAVVDIGTGTTLFAHRAGTVVIPASVTKLMTSAAALAELGPEHRFTTKVVRAGGEGEIVLVGGGDPYLASTSSAKTYPARASVADLAKKTAVALKQGNTTSVTLGYDATLFSGPSWNPTWPAGYSSQTTRTSALWVDEGRLAGVSPGPRTDDPAGHAAKAFAAALKKNGITVSKVAKARAAEDDPVLAAVQSMPLERIVERVLMASDNDAAEVLFRQVAVAAGRPGSITAARQEMKVALTKLDAWHEDTVVYDGSGLSRDNRIGAATLTRLLRLAAHESHPELRGLITGLPVAGVEGSLRHRFSDDEAMAARGMVRGKTGTLRQVYSLAGFVRTNDGSLVAYAFLTNGAAEYAAKQWLDGVAAAIAGCGCQV